jgi:hypothetical protein
MTKPTNKNFSNVNEFEDSSDDLEEVELDEDTKKFGKIIKSLLSPFNNRQRLTIIKKWTEEEDTEEDS